MKIEMMTPSVAAVTPTIIVSAIDRRTSSRPRASLQCVVVNMSQLQERRQGLGEHRLRRRNLQAVRFGVLDDRVRSHHLRLRGRGRSDRSGVFVREVLRSLAGAVLRARHGARRRRHTADHGPLRVLREQPANTCRSHGQVPQFRHSGSRWSARWCGDRWCHSLSLLEGICKPLEQPCLEEW